MNSSNWIRITSVDNIPPRQARAVELGGASVAIVNMGDRFCAVENRCPHSQGPLADGIVGHNFVTCPIHGWRISVETGRVVKPAGATASCVRTFPVKVEDGIVMLDMAQQVEAPVAA